MEPLSAKASAAKDISKREEKSQEYGEMETGKSIEGDQGAVPQNWDKKWAGKRTEGTE